MSTPISGENRLGTYLKARRAKLDPAELGITPRRRRTPGLRREEVAQRAHVSVTWYTWLEQGRGGAPSADVLDRLARALMLSVTEREHLFLLALGRTPEVEYHPSPAISPQLQRVLDALEWSPAYVKTPAWDVVAWNRAAGVVFGYDELPPGQNNILRRIFTDSHVRTANPQWKSVARFVVAAFRADAARAGAENDVAELVEDLCRESAEFAALWREQDVSSHGEGTKHLLHPEIGSIFLEYSAFLVDGHPGLGMVVYNPASVEDAEKLRTFMKSRAADGLATEA